MSSRKPGSGEFAIVPGRIYNTSDPEHLGDRPVRNPIQVLSADNPGKNSIGWTVKENNGGAVYRLDDKNEVIRVPITIKDSLAVGDRILATTLVGEVMATVERDGVGDLCWVSGGYVGDLEYDKTRHYWVTSIAINKKLLAGK